MITKAQVKHIQSLADKKNRYAHREFVVEGVKLVQELINSGLPIHAIYALEEWINSQPGLRNATYPIHAVLPHELERISVLQTANKVIAVAAIPQPSKVDSQLALVLDHIQDPGNLGSIIRIADWYNIPTIYCSEDCADMYNPKVVQASMGSVFRINVLYTDLEKEIQQHPGIPTYASVLDGEDINHFDSIQKGFILIGNESKGLRPSLAEQSTYKVSICRKGGAESLNAAIATGIICHCLLS
jgi:RNA methyltransferase, TrmH family